MFLFVFLFFEQQQIKSGALTDKQPPVLVLRALPFFWSPGLGTSMTATYFARKHSSKAIPNFEFLAAKHAMFASN